MKPQMVELCGEGHRHWEPELRSALWPQSCGLRVKDRAPRLLIGQVGDTTGTCLQVSPVEFLPAFKPPLAVKSKAVSGGWIFLLQSLCENFYRDLTSCIDALGNSRFGIKINILSEVGIGCRWNIFLCDSQNKILESR